MRDEANEEWLRESWYCQTVLLDNSLALLT